MSRSLDGQALTLSLAEAIGTDYAAYVTSADEKRHIDTFAVVEAYAAWLLLKFLSAAAIRLRTHLEEVVKRTGERFADKLWEGLKYLSRLRAVRSRGDKQDGRIQSATKTLSEISSSFDRQLLELFLQGGQTAIEYDLLKDNFPPHVAREKATLFSQILESSLAAKDSTNG